MDRPAKITAQVAPYLDAIRHARAGGWSWRELTERVAPRATTDAVRAAVKACKYQVEQLPLPEAAPAPEKVPAQQNETVPASDSQQETPVVVNYGGFDKPKPKRVFDDDK